MSFLLCLHLRYLCGITTWIGPMVLLPQRCIVCCYHLPSCLKWVSRALLENVPLYSSEWPQLPPFHPKVNSYHLGIFLLHPRTLFHIRQISGGKACYNYKSLVNGCITFWVCYFSCMCRNLWMSDVKHLGLVRVTFWGSFLSSRSQI